MVTVNDLPELIGTPFDNPDRQLFLYCPVCRSEWSATRGDYWYVPDDTSSLVCCGEPMILAKIEKAMKIVKA